MTLHPALDGIQLVVFDKGGTLISFEAMWSGWARELGRRLDGATRRPVSGDVFATIGFDPVAGRVLAGAPLSVETMGEIRETVAAVVRRWCPSVAAARRAVDAAWFKPDPVASAVPIADLPALFSAMRGFGRLIVVATTDDRAPTEATLRALSVRAFVSAIACGDDGVGVKPDPAMLLALCATVGIPPAATAIVGDTPADLAMGRAAGAGRVLAVLTGVGSREELAPLADEVLGSVGDLLVAA